MELEAQLERARAELAAEKGKPSSSVPKAGVPVAPQNRPIPSESKLATPKMKARDETKNDKDDEACSSILCL